MAIASPFPLQSLRMPWMSSFLVVTSAGLHMEPPLSLDAHASRSLMQLTQLHGDKRCGLFGRLAIVRRCANCRKEVVVVVAEEVVEEEHADMMGPMGVAG